MSTLHKACAGILLGGLLSLASAADSLQVAPAPIPTIHFHGTLTDSVFKGNDSISAELIETGEKHWVKLGESFPFTLPLDTIWNLCFTAKAQEKCYDVKYLGHDSAFSLVINGDELVTWFSDSSVTRVAKIPDSTQAKAADTVDLSKLVSDNGKPTELRKVVVQLRRKPKHRMGESVVSTKDIKRMPGLAEADVMRSIQALPGVVASSDFSTKIYVRGGGSDQNLFLFDNAVVYSPVHFFGLFSTFLVDGIDDVNFYKSGFAPEYGNRLSSVVDLHSRLGGLDTVERIFDSSSVSISTFATQIHTEGHEGDTRWLVAARTTYIQQVLDALEAMKVISFSLNYHFTDIQGDIEQSLGEDRSIMLSWYTGSDVLLFDPIDVSWGNTVIPLNFKWRINDDWLYKATASYSEFDQNYAITGLFGLYNKITTLSLKQSATNDAWWEGHELTAGWDLEYNKVNFSENVAVASVNFVDTGTVWMNSLYLQDHWRPDPWEFNYGMRITYQDLVGEFAFEPRFTAQYHLDENSHLNAHLGYYKQFLNSILFSNQEMLNEFYYPSRDVTSRVVEPTSSWMGVLGYARDKILGQFGFSTEAYYKTQNNLIIFNTSSADTGTMKYLGDKFINGEGYSFGYELALKRELGVITGDVNWSQGWSVIRNQGDTVAYYPAWHQPFALKGSLSINWRGEHDAIFPPAEKHSYLHSSISVKYASGLPYTEYLGYQQTEDLNQSDGKAGGGFASMLAGGAVESEGNMTARLGNLNTSLLPPYFRIDVKPFDIGRDGRWEFSWTILNVTDHNNVFMTTTNTNSTPPKTTTIYQFPFFPILLNYEYHF